MTTARFGAVRIASRVGSPGLSSVRSKTPGHVGETIIPLLGWFGTAVSVGDAASWVVASHPKEVPGPSGIPSRAEQIKRLSQPSDNVYDIIVVGGGATGAGIALDAASRGLRVACIERGDFSSETSSRSTKLIWAGIKYMGTAVAALLSSRIFSDPVGTLSTFQSEMRMVYHCHVERHYMTTKQRHLCQWIPIAVPFTSWYVTPPPMKQPLYSFFPVLAPITFKFYDALSAFRCPPSYIMTPSTTATVFPQLKQDNLKYCAVFYEGQHNDARTNLAIAMSAAAHGAHICNYVEMKSLTHDERDDCNSRVNGCTVVDRMTGKSWNMSAKHVILAGGPFTDTLRETDAEKEFKPAVRGASGVHIVLPGGIVPKNMGLLDFNSSDGRFLFILPWKNHTLVGTTDEKCPAKTIPTAPENQVDWLLREAKTHLFSAEELNRAHVSSAWQGWRPLAADPHGEDKGGSMSRDHVIAENPQTGLIFIAGGKWTTWREMAEEVTDRVVKKLTSTQSIPQCHTLDIGLHGADGFSDDLAEQLRTKYPTLDDETADHLVDTFGGSCFEVCKNSGPGNHLVRGFPYTEAEVAYACKEYACTVEDVLSRRTRLAFLDKDAALAALPRVADIMAKELGWSRATKRRQIKHAVKYVSSYNGRIAE